MAPSECISLMKAASEMQEPIGYIESIASILRRQLLNVKGKKRVENREIRSKLISTLFTQSWLLLNYLNDVIDLAAIKAGAYKPESTKFDPNQVFQQTIEMFQEKANSLQISFNWKT